MTERIAVHTLVLVVDDDPDLRALLADLLTLHGYGVVVAQHGKDGIDRLREHSPHLVVLDLNMPVMDGWQFRAEQQHLADEQLASVPVLLVTGADGAAHYAAALKAVGVIEKPVDPDRFVVAIQTALAAAQA